MPLGLVTTILVVEIGFHLFAGVFYTAIPIAIVTDTIVDVTVLLGGLMVAGCRLQVMSTGRSIHSGFGIERSED